MHAAPSMKDFYELLKQKTSLTAFDYAYDSKSDTLELSCVKDYSGDFILYDATTSGTTISGWYRVRKSWQNASSQKGAFHDLNNAKQCADANPGYTVYDPEGKAVYPDTPAASVPYAVRVSINDLNIRKGPGTNYVKTGQHTGKGVFTIVAESAGTGSTKGWGKLKSGAGWISLDYCTRI